MAALPLSVRYASFDTTVVHFLPTIAAATLIPTRAEVTAGTDLTGEISDVSGFSVTGNDIDAPDLKSEFVGKVPGRTMSEDSTLTFYASENSVDVRTILTYKLIGFIVLMHGGDVQTRKMDVYPVRVRSVGKTISVSDSLATIVVGFSVTREPALNVAVPVAAV